MQIDRHSTELQKKQKGCLFMKHRVEANWCGLAHLSPLYEYFCWSLSATPPPSQPLLLTVYLLSSHLRHNSTQLSWLEATVQWR